MDPVLGIVKADIGIKDGRIVGIGQAGNPYVQDGVDPQLTVGAGTEVISGEGLVATAGAIDTHVHFLTPEQIPHALANGVTTLIGGGTGPADGSRGTTCTPGPWNLARMLEASAELPVNVGLLGKGNSSRPETSGRAARSRRLRAEGARGLGGHARGDRLCADRRRRLRRPGRRCTPTRSTRAGIWQTRSRRSTVAPSTATTPRVRAAATRRT